MLYFACFETCMTAIWLITDYFTYWQYQTQTTRKHCTKVPGS